MAESHDSQTLIDILSDIQKDKQASLEQAQADVARAQQELDHARQQRRLPTGRNPVKDAERSLATAQEQWHRAKQEKDSIDQQLLEAQRTMPQADSQAQEHLRPGASGEKQAREAVLADFTSTHGNAQDLTSDKDVNRPGTDMAIVASDAETARVSLVVGDNKDMRHPRASSWDEKKVETYIDQGLNMIAATDYREPLPSNDMRVPWNIAPSADPDERFPAEKARDEEALTASPSSPVHEHTELELAAEYEAQRGDTLNYYATTTGTHLHQPAIDKLAEKGMKYKPINAPEVTQNATARRRDAWKDQPPSAARAEQEQSAPEQGQEHGHGR